MDNSAEELSTTRRQTASSDHIGRKTGCSE
nr:MAG TPA: hypothetical protein [Caudoviricetes sp.]DAY88234.1 MAG TPA: hypothetical protein [Caudoviricetes sp.]DAY94861.1 MAG TPA: hypothetical protein [Caudoviricetes sp.]